MGIDERLSIKKISSLCVGLEIYKARNRLLRMIPGLESGDIDMVFTESNLQRYTVQDCSFDEKSGKIILTVSTNHCIRRLPSNYQTNDFLYRFLMIFQHLYNETAVTLDNVHELFRPMECPPAFLGVLSGWFGIHLDTLGGEDEVRRFLQYAIPLFRFRGTPIGLRIYLAIVSGVVPEIHEGSLPYSALEITDTAVTEVHIFEAVEGKDYFTVYFPVERNTFDDALVRRLSLIVQQEKPVHTRCFISFKTPEIKKRKITTISSDTIMGSDGGISL